MKCWRRFLPLLIGLPLLAAALSFTPWLKGFVERDLSGKATSYLTGANINGVSVKSTGNHDITLTGPKSLETSAREALAARRGSDFGYNKVIYNPTEEPAPAPTTTVAPVTTTAAPVTTTAAPATTTTAAPATTTTVAPTTTKAPAPVATVPAAVCSSTLDGVKFATSAADLLPESLPILDAAAANLAKATCKVEIQGHTDIRGTVASNNALSQARADSVRNYLISKGIAADRLTAVGYGSSQPKVPGDDEAAWSQNRRIEFKVQGS
jgi:outer membrane protein OmpA-like peptidoglycan-associated protein